MNSVVTLPTGEEAFGQLRWYVVDAQLPLEESPVICVVVPNPEHAVLAYANRHGRAGAIAMLQFVSSRKPDRFFSWVDGADQVQ